MYRSKGTLRMGWAVIFLLFLTAMTACTRHTAYGLCPYRLQTGECRRDLAARTHDADLLASTDAAVDVLLQGARFIRSNPGQSIGVSSVFNLNRLHTTSPLGRLLGEQIGKRLTEHGYTTIKLREWEMRVDEENSPQPILPFEGGVELMRGYPISVFCTGSYTVGANAVYVVLKLLHTPDGVLLASHSFSLPLGRNTYALLYGPG